jgi:hypothetical protein
MFLLIAPSIVLQDYWVKGLTNEELFAAFPGFELLPSIERVVIEYEGSKLYQIRVNLNTSPRVTIRMWGTNTTSISDFETDVFDVLGTSAIINVSEWSGSLEARFILDGIFYNLSVNEREENDENNQLLKMLVNEIIRSSVVDGLKADLSVFENPVVPELRDDRFTLEQAYADPDFGMYIPENIPIDSDCERYGESIWRVVDHFYERQSRLSISLSCEQSRFNWTISTLDSSHLNNLVSPSEREKYDWALYPVSWNLPIELRSFINNPTFRARDMTLDILKTRIFCWEERFNRPESGWDIDSFAILLDNNIVIEVKTKNIPVEKVWEMLEIIIEQNTFTTADALLVLQAVAGLTTLTNEQTARLGIFGAPTTADALQILRIVAGLT